MSQEPHLSPPLSTTEPSAPSSPLLPPEQHEVGQRIERTLSTQRRNSAFGPTKGRTSKALLALIEAATADAGQVGDSPRNSVSDHPDEATLGHKSPATVATGTLASLSQADLPTGGRTVAELRPRPGLLIDCGTSVAVAARKMVSMNTDVALIQASDGSLKGILTDTDVTRKLVALGHDPDRILVDAIMTPQPHCVSKDTTAVTALWTMMEKRFRHLPVINDGFQVQGVLDVAKCLHDAISRLDSISLGKSVKLGSLLPLPGPLGTSGARDKSGGAAIMANASVRQAAAMISKRRSGLLVEARGRPCVGIITPKDLLFRVVAAGLPIDTTTVETVMTPQPDTMSPSDSVLDALRQLQGTGYRTVPVVSASGEPYGVLDILGLMQGALHTAENSRSSATRTTATDLASSVDGSVFRDESVTDRAESVAETVSLHSEAHGGNFTLDHRAESWVREVSTAVEEKADEWSEEETLGGIAERISGIAEQIASMQQAMTEVAQLEAKLDARAEERESRLVAQCTRWAALGAPAIFAAGMLFGVAVQSRRW